MSNPVIADIVKEVVGERHRLVRWLRLNASTNRNLPSDESAYPEVKVIHEHVSAPVAIPNNPAVPVSPIEAAKKEWPMWLKTLIAAGALSATGGGGAGLSYWLNRPVNPPAVVNPDTGSLLQYLEDSGYHVNEKK